VAPQALVLVVTDPPDPLADVVRMLGHGRVLSTGTYLDGLRFRFHLARRLGVSPACVDAQIVGEHGTTEVFLWSSARIAGKPVLELLERTAGQNREVLRQQIERQVRYANIAIIEGIGANQHGIGMAGARIAEILSRNEPAVIPIASYNAEYDVTLSLPSVLGRSGVSRILEPPMSDEERKALRRSADTLKSALARMHFSPS
jgi:L-lactate dehydrogenase